MAVLLSPVSAMLGKSSYMVPFQYPYRRLSKKLDNMSALLNAPALRWSREGNKSHLRRPMINPAHQ